jgi:transposase
MKRVIEMTGTSMSSVKIIRREAKGEETTKFESPRKRQKKRAIENVALDYFDCDVIRRTIHEFYAVHKIVPTIRKLIPVLREKINFTHQRETLRKILHEIGFRFKKSQNKRKQIMERSDIILSRTQFLRNIKRYREENRPIVYLDETWIDSNLTFGKCWQTNGTVGVLETGNASRRIIVLCAGGDMGFIPNSNLLYKANSTSGDYHGQMNSRIFEKWAEEKLIPNLPQNSVVVIDNAPYHSIQLNKVPNSSNRKQEIMDWLASNNIPCSSDLRKIELLDLVKRNQPRTKLYKFDTMLQDNGFTALRLPPYHCDINAIEYVWAEIKNHIRNLNVTGDLNLSRLLTFSNEAIENVTTEHWGKYCSHVVSLENMYWKMDGVIEDLVDPLIIDVSNTDSDSDSDSSSDE